MNPSIAVEQERWNDLQRNAERYRLHRSQAQDQCGTRILVRRRRSG